MGQRPCDLSPMLDVNCSEQRNKAGQINEASRENWRYACYLLVLLSTVQLAWYSTANAPVMPVTYSFHDE